MVNMLATPAESYELEVTDGGWALSAVVPSKSNEWMIADTELEYKHEGIIRAVCEAVGVNWQQVKSRSHRRRDTIARHIIASELYRAGETLETVGAIINRDHSTAYYGIKCARNEHDTEMAEYYKKYRTIKQLTKRQGGRNEDRLLTTSCRRGVYHTRK